MFKALSTLLLTGSLAQAQMRIEPVIPQKGYILSIDLVQKKCEKIWSKQIGIFKKNNPHIKDPNILSIGKEIQVQNCMIQEQAVIKKEEPKKEISQEKKKESKKAGIMISVGAQYNSIDKKDSDEGKHGSGYRLDIGKRFENNKKSELKVSLGLIKNETKTDSDLESKRDLLALDLGYLWNINSHIKIGPNAEILYNSISSSFKNQPNKDKVNPYIGVDSEIKIYKDLFLDLKIQKSISERMDFVNSIGLGLDF